MSRAVMMAWEDGYSFAGVLTAIAAAVVTVVILVTSGIDDNI
ncbi:MAG TPA: hypothetical protein VGB33_04445 [Acidimicrobiia bacterium]